MKSSKIHDATALPATAETRLIRAGLETEKAAAVAGILVEGDLLGHTTHGLQLLAPYLAEIEGGRMQRSGEPHVIAEPA